MVTPSRPWHVAPRLVAGRVAPLVAAFLLPGCPAGDDDDSAAGDGTASDDDTTSDDDASGDDDSPAAEARFGSVYVGHSLGHAFGSDWDSYATGAFFYDPASVTEVSGETVVDPLDGTGDCGLIVRDFSVPSGDPWDYLSAGTLHVQGGDIDEELEPITAYGQVYYNLDLGGLGYAPSWGEPFSFAAQGADLPAFDQADAVTFPGGPLEITSPALVGEVVIPHGDLAFAWTPGDAETLQLYVQGGLEDPQFGWRIECIAQDDGAFTVPAALVTQLPREDSVYISLARADGAWYRVAGDPWIWTSATVDSVFTAVFE